MAVRNAIQGVKGVSSVEVDRDTGRVTVAHDGNASRDEMVQAVKRAGYSVAG